MKTILFSTGDDIGAVVLQCLPCSKETETNWADLSIANSICYYLYCIVFICVAGVVLWKILGIIEQRWKDCCQHKWEMKSLMWKQRSNLTERLLDFLKDKTSEKNNNKGKQANNSSSQISPEDIYNLLKDNAVKSSPAEVRQRYVELCVELLKKQKADTDKPLHGVSTPQESSPTSENHEGDGDQISDETSMGKSDDASNDKNPSDIYKDVLCYLIGSTHKSELNDTDINSLKNQCGLNPQTT